MLFPKISTEKVNSWYPYKQFWPRNPDSAMKPSSNYAIFYCLSICLILTVFRFVGAKLHFRFQHLSVFGHAFLMNKLCQIFERYLTKCVLFLTQILSGIHHKYESVAFRQLTRAQIRFKIDPFTKCQTNTVKKHTPLQYIPALTLVT